MQQVHGASVAAVDGPRPDPVRETDGLVTATPGLALVVLVADCVPVLIASPTAVAAVHAGRVGAAAGVLPAAVSALSGAGADLGAADALLGPAVCGACYEVPAEMRDEVEAALPGSATATRRGRPGLDLRGGLARQLSTLGIPRIVIDSRCTAEDPELFSHRRDGTTGRQAALTWLEP
jgi:YfiH family protein